MRLTADDFTFIVKVLSRSETDHVSLVKLLVDEDTRDAILDHELLAKAILESPQRLPISPQLLHMHSGEAYRVAFDPVGRYLASADHEGHISIVGIP